MVDVYKTANVLLLATKVLLNLNLIFTRKKTVQHVSKVHIKNIGNNCVLIPDQQFAVNTKCFSRSRAFACGYRKLTTSSNVCLPF